MNEALLGSGAPLVPMVVGRRRERRARLAVRLRVDTARGASVAGGGMGRVRTGENREEEDGSDGLGPPSAEKRG